MSNKNNDFVSLLQDLCEMYEIYISKNVDSKLQVLIQDNKISINLYNGDDVIDSFELSFSEQENDRYLYLSVIIMKILFGKSIMYNKDNLFYNDNKPYLEVVVNDEDMLSKIFSVIAMGKKINVYSNIDAINRKVYVKQLEERIYLSKRLLRMDGR